MSTEHLIIPVRERDHIAGSLDAPVVLVEYGDFECPHCGRAHPVVRSAQRALGDQLCFVYRHFPLSEIHPHAQLAAESAEAAGAQKKFWPMHDMLFEHQEALDVESLLAYAAAIGCDARRVAHELREATWTERVLDDYRSGLLSGVSGTPTFFINGLRYNGPWVDPVAFTEVLAQLAARAGAHR
jgi:protein-disulfide isomerase